MPNQTGRAEAIGAHVFFALFAWYFLHWIDSETPAIGETRFSRLPGLDNSATRRRQAISFALHVWSLVYPFDIHTTATYNGYTICISKKGAAMHTTLFLSNRTQAVRLPKSISFPEDVKHVEIIAVGRSRVITPVGESWDSWFDSEDASTDFMSTREQPAEQQRERF